MTNLAYNPIADVLPVASAATFRRLFRKNVSYNLLLAIENDDNAPAAIRITDALATRGAVPSVVRTAEIMATIATPGDAGMVYTAVALGPEFQEAQKHELASIIRDTLNGDRDWPLLGLVGDAASTIVFDAEER